MNRNIVPFTLINFIRNVDNEIESFLAANPKVKSAFRAAFATLVVAAAEHYGVLGVLSDIFNATGT